MTDQRALVTDGRVARRRCHSSIAPSAIKASRNGTKIGINAAVTDRVAEAMSSTKERGGPRKATLATGRTAALVTCTVPAVAPPARRLTITASPESIEVMVPVCEANRIAPAAADTGSITAGPTESDAGTLATAKS